MSQLMVTPPLTYFGNEKKKEAVKATVQKAQTGKIKIFLPEMTFKEKDTTKTYGREASEDQFELKDTTVEKSKTRIKDTGFEMAFKLFNFLGDGNEELATQLAEQMQHGDVEIEFVTGTPDDKKQKKGVDNRITEEIPFDVKHTSTVMKKGNLDKTKKTTQGKLKGKMLIEASGTKATDQAQGMFSLIGDAIKLKLKQYLTKQKTKTTLVDEKNENLVKA